MSSKIASAAAAIAKQKNLDYVINKEVCFYIRSDLDCTPMVIDELNKSFDLESKNSKKLSDNEGGVEQLDSIEESALDARING